MFKFIFYLVVFVIIGYSYGKITEGTMFDNFFAMIISMFIFIFLVEWIASRFKKNKNTEEKESKEQDHETWDEMIASATKDFEKTWNLTYENNEIQIVNRYNHEQLFINGELVSEKKRNGVSTWLAPSQTLKGTIVVQNQPQVIKVKLGGLISLNCRVYVGRELIFKKKLKYNLLSGGVKESD
ncbi:hypothetical protein [Litchfieldia salsa]|uniref:Uncharacterized protein n=1 Tax=Litchfieldia salsa TaxID=930152 RepID=A0A1H0PGH0_9BACI|nr:hypothetical protein [Litchfieldia salsa]SDP03860.1 hypothetical protein SAMN05216565_101299 [Litchfieldia salsa]